MIIAIWGSKGAGKTTIAVNIADLLSKDKRVAIMSACLLSPTISLFFSDVVKKHSIFRALRDPSQTGINHSYSDNKKLSIYDMSLKEHSIMSSHITDEQVANLIDYVNDKHQILIIDCESNYNHVITRQALIRADEVYFLVKPELESLAFYCSNIMLMSKLKINEKASYILNMSSKKISSKIIEQQLGINFAHQIKENKLLKLHALRGITTSKRSNRKFFKTAKKIAQEIK